MGANASYVRYASSPRGLRIVEVTLSRRSWAGKDVPGRVRIELVRGSRVVTTRRCVIHTGLQRRFSLAAPRVPFQVRAHIAPSSRCRGSGKRHTAAWRSGFVQLPWPALGGGVEEAENRESLLEALADVHAQMAARDTVFHAWEEELRLRDKRIAGLEDELRDAGEHIRHLTATIDLMRTTRAWRLATGYWKVRDRMKSVVHSR
jgi:hypothetical protein